MFHLSQVAQLLDFGCILNVSTGHPLVAKTWRLECAINVKISISELKTIITLLGSGWFSDEEILIMRLDISLAGLSRTIVAAGDLRRRRTADESQLSIENLLPFVSRSGPIQRSSCRAAHRSDHLLLKLTSCDNANKPFELPQHAQGRACKGFELKCPQPRARLEISTKQSSETRLSNSHQPAHRINYHLGVWLLSRGPITEIVSFQAGHSSEAGSSCWEPDYALRSFHSWYCSHFWTNGGVQAITVR